MLDRKFLRRVKRVSFLGKCIFILKKYCAIAKHFFVPYQLGVSKIIWKGRSLFYNDGLGGLGGYQSVLSEHMYWIDQLPLPVSPVLVDVGANVGYLSQVFKERFPSSSVYSFEPSAVTYGVLCRNLAGYTGIHTYCMALGSCEGTMCLVGDPSLPALSHISESGVLGEPVILKTLDDVLQEEHMTQHIDILKIDVEGYELNVLKGCMETLRRVSYIHIEVNAAQYLFSDLFAILADGNVRCQLLFVRNFSNESDGRFMDGDMLLKVLPPLETISSG